MVIGHAVVTVIVPGQNSGNVMRLEPTSDFLRNAGTGEQGFKAGSDSFRLKAFDALTSNGRCPIAQGAGGDV